MLGMNSFECFAQKNSSPRKNTVKLKTEIVIVNEEGAPLSNVILTVDEGENVYSTDENGKVKLEAKSNSTLLVEADGYNELLVDLSKKTSLTKIVMKEKNDETIYRQDGSFLLSSHFIGARDVVSGNDLMSYPDFSLSNTLQGRLSGLLASATVSGLGNNGSTLFVRGLHGFDENQAIVIVDGVERSFEDIISEEVESIEVLKDATAKILYGPRAANGVVVIRTKRGKINKRKINVAVEGGVLQATRLPNYLNSYQYAILYNEARRNDGLPTLFSDEDLLKFQRSNRADDVLYPNVDYYDTFIKNLGSYKKVVLDLNGGTEKVRYAMIANYLGGGGFEKVGETTKMDRLNVRGNLDIKATDFLSIVADGAVRMDIKSWGAVDNGNLFSRISSLRPNEYPLTIPSDMLNVVQEDDVPCFGTSLKDGSNLYADVKYGGFTEEKQLTSQLNLGLNFDLNKVLKGLRADAYISFDNSNYFKQGQRNVYPTYAFQGMVDNEPTFLKMKNLKLQGDQSRLGENTLSTLGWRSNVAYFFQFKEHQLDAALAYNFYNKGVRGGSQDIKNSNLSLRLNYNYDSKYLFEGDLAYMGSNRFASDNRFFTSYALGGGWIVSKESFMKYSKIIDFLKLKTSFGILGYDRSVPFLLYETAWTNGGSINWGEQNKGTSSHVTSFGRLGNPDLKWESSREFNIGLEAYLLNKRLFFETNYFNEIRENIISYADSEMVGVLGDFKRYYNMGKVRNNGVEFLVRWQDRIADFKYQISGNLLYSKNKILERNEVSFNEYGLNTIGKSTDAMVGYKYLGLLGKDIPVSEAKPQFIGNYQEGDLIYADLNNDGYVDNLDQEQLGNLHPRVSLGIDINLNYKGWGLYLLGVSELGMDIWKKNSYYANYGERKYSVVALNRYHPENNPGGNYPRLTTSSLQNNFVNSSFWIEKGNFFRLKNLEISHKFSFKDNKWIKSLKLFGRANNLFVISKVKDLDPEVLDAGVSNYPLYRTFTGGLVAEF